MSVHRDHRGDDGVFVPVRDADAQAVDSAGLEPVLAIRGDQRMLLERQPDRVSLHPRRHGMRMQGRNSLRDHARRIRASPPGLHLAEGGTQDAERLRRARIGLRGQCRKTLRPVPELANRDIDLQGIDRPLDRRLEWPQRAAAVEAEQGADVLGAAAVGGVLAGENGRSRADAGAKRLIHRRHRGGERGAGRTNGGELARALAAHQHLQIGGLVLDFARGLRDRLIDLPATVVGHERPADQQAAAAAALLARPLDDRLADIAQRLEVLDEGERLGRLQHVDPAADQEPRRAHARDQRQRGFELGRETGEIGELGVVRPIAIDDGAGRRRTEPPERDRACDELVPRHPHGIPVGRPHQQCRLHREH